MDVSIFLAKFLGLYFIIACGAVLVRRKQVLKMMDQWLKDDPMMMMGGFMATVFGLLILLFHNIWTLDWRVFITIIGWISLIKGISLFYFPGKMKEFSKKIIKHKAYMVSLVVFLFLGFFLLIMGFIS